MLKREVLTTCDVCEKNEGETTVPAISFRVILDSGEVRVVDICGVHMAEIPLLDLEHAAQRYGRRMVIEHDERGRLVLTPSVTRPRSRRNYNRASVFHEPAGLYVKNIDQGQITLTCLVPINDLGQICGRTFGGYPGLKKHQHAAHGLLIGEDED